MGCENTPQPISHYFFSLVLICSQHKLFCFIFDPCRLRRQVDLGEIVLCHLALQAVFMGMDCQGLRWQKICVSYCLVFFPLLRVSKVLLLSCWEKRKESFERSPLLTAYRLSSGTENNLFELCYGKWLSMGIRNYLCLPQVIVTLL